MTDHITRGLHDLMRDAQDFLEADAAVAPALVTDSARARRRRSGALLATVAVVGCVSVGAASIGVVNGGGEAEPAFSASPSAVPAEDLSVPLKSVSIPLHSEDASDPIRALMECGADAPAPTGVVDHFGVTINAQAPLMLPRDSYLTGMDQPVDAWITYDDVEPTPAAQTPITLLLVQDGKVAGLFYPVEPAQGMWTFNDKEPYYGAASMGLWGDFCPGASADEVGPGQSQIIAPGDYQVIPVARIQASKEVAALRQLYLGGVSTFESSADNEDGIYSPGSWDCRQLANGGSVPRVCLGDATGTAIVDVNAGTVTLPYDEEFYVRDVDVLLVGDPVDLIVEEQTEMPDFVDYESAALGPDDPLECGARFDYLDSGSVLRIDASLPAELQDGANAVNAKILVERPGKGEFTLDYDSLAYLVGPISPDTNYFADQPGNRQVIGVADVSIAGGNTVEYNRYDGPVTVNLVFTHVDMCGEVNPTYGIDSVIIEAAVTVSPDDAETEVLDHTRIEVTNYGDLS